MEAEKIAMVRETLNALPTKMTEPLIPLGPVLRSVSLYLIRTLYTCVSVPLLFFVMQAIPWLALSIWSLLVWTYEWLVWSLTPILLPLEHLLLRPVLWSMSIVRFFQPLITFLTCGLVIGSILGLISLYLSDSLHSHIQAHLASLRPTTPQKPIIAPRKSKLSFHYTLNDHPVTQSSHASENLAAKSWSAHLLSKRFRSYNTDTSATDDTAAENTEGTCAESEDQYLSTTSKSGAEDFSDSATDTPSTTYTGSTMGSGKKKVTWAVPEQVMKEERAQSPVSAVVSAGSTRSASPVVQAGVRRRLGSKERQRRAAVRR